MHIGAENYRGLQSAVWDPSGVCALVGPNGTGKTTLLDVPNLLRHAYERDYQSAINHPSRGGAWFLRNLQGEPDAVPLVGMGVGSVAWFVAFEIEGATVSPLCGEWIKTPTGTLASRKRLSSDISFENAKPSPKKRSRAKARPSAVPRTVLAEISDMPEVQPLVRLVTNYRFYRTYNLAALQRHGSQQTGDTVLDADGGNLFAVLRNWRDTTAGMQRWDFVMESMRTAFPGQFQDLKFEVAGLTVTGRISLPAFDQFLPVALAPEGVMTGLLHLTAVASAEPGCALAIDEVENSLHPHAIRAILAAMRERAEELDLTVLLATHSPVVIDQFKDHPEQLFVLEPGEKKQPVPLSKLRDPGYLAQFSLGDLYANERFGAPKTK